jgi:hypothetical protein
MSAGSSSGRDVHGVPGDDWPGWHKNFPLSIHSKVQSFKGSGAKQYHVGWFRKDHVIGMPPA